MITNGLISGFKGNGIFTGSSLNRIALSNLSIVNCSTSAINTVGVASPNNNTLYINNCFTTACGETDIDSWTDVYVSNFTATQSASGNSLVFNRCTNIIADRIMCANTANADLAIDVANSTSGTFTNCVVFGNSSSISSASINIVRSTGINFSQCYILNNTAPASPLNIAVQILGTTGNCEFDNFVIGGLTSGGSTVGFGATVAAIEALNIKDSIIYNNSSTSVSSPCVGIFLSTDVARSVIANNILLANTNTSGGSAYGINFTNTASTNSVVFKNTISSNTTFGVNFAATGANQFIQNLSTKNGTNYSLGISATSIQTATLAQISTNLTVPWTNVSLT